MNDLFIAYIDIMMAYSKKLNYLHFFQIQINAVDKRRHRGTRLCTNLRPKYSLEYLTVWRLYIYPTHTLSLSLIESESFALHTGYLYPLSTTKSWTFYENWFYASSPWYLYSFVTWTRMTYWKPTQYVYNLYYEHF